MSFAFLGRVEGRLCLYSQLTGVVPGYQSRGLGYEIKRLQRTIAHAEGIERIAWAFDPLQAGNAHFNLARLGATAGRLHRKHVRTANRRTQRGRSDRPPDRRVGHRGRCGRGGSVPDAVALPHLIETEQGRGDVPGAPLGLDESALRSPARPPRDPQRHRPLRRETPELAEQWRSAVGQAFQAAFAAGYRAVHFVRDDSIGPATKLLRARTGIIDATFENRNQASPRRPP